ncbi:MAG: SDR family NAD(P)-dependent oxidoreductase [Gammaproteobacteria bacterium]|nr:SDR family NAD(P)-dependent oxidoreductase [Gammaproteobacteria bacterium]
MGKATVNRNGLLAGKVAVVTGASRGIGEAVALRYAMEGARVVVSARTVEEGQHLLPGSISATVKRIRDAGGEALAVRADISREEDRMGLIDAAEAAFGPVDILVNNAAVTFYAPVVDFVEKKFRLMMEVQVWAPYQLSQRVLPAMVQKRSGWILNVSSHAAIHPEKTLGRKGGSVYGMCKAALERFTTGLAVEHYDDNIGVNVISPGLVATPGAVHHNLITEQTKHRVTPVEHMAEVCLRLVHGDARQLTGRIDYADQVMKEFSLTAAELI